MPSVKKVKENDHSYEKDNTITFEPKNVKELSDFFENSGDKYHEIWIILTKKKHVDHQPVSFAEAVEEAAQHNLVDSRTQSVDERRYRIRFTSRKTRKPQPAINRETAERVKPNS